MASLPQQSNSTSISAETHQQLRDALLAPGGDSIITASQPAPSVSTQDDAFTRSDSAVRGSARNDRPHTSSGPNTSSKPADSNKRATKKMAATVAQPIPSQGAHHPGGTAYDGGDTQPMESQVYRDYTESMARDAHVRDQEHIEQLPKLAEVEESQCGLREGNYTNGTVVSNYTTHTYQEGETGHINLLGDWQDNTEEHNMNDSGEGGRTQEEEYLAGLLESQPTQSRPGEGYEFKMPETPATAGRKLGRDGQVLSSGSTSTKHTALRLFGETANGLTATQMFDQTQEPSSPGPICPPTVGIMTRPSPNIEPRFATFSSPSLAHPTRQDERMVKTFPEPISQYRSARRSSPLLDEQSAQDNEDDDFEDENSLELKVQREKQGRELGNRIRRELSTVSAPPRPDSGNKIRPTPRKSSDQIDLTHSTPATAYKGHAAFDNLLDAEQEDDPMAIENGERGDEPTLEDEDYVHDLNDDDDVYDEQSQSVIKRRAERTNDEDSDEESDDQEIDEARMGNEDANVSSRKSKAVPNTQQSAIADSPYHGHPRMQANVSQGTTQHSSTSLVRGTQFQDASNHIIASPATKASNQSVEEGTNETVVPQSSLRSSPPMSISRDRADEDCVMTDSTALTSPQHLPGAQVASPLRLQAAPVGQKDPYSTANTHLSANSPSKEPFSPRSLLDLPETVYSPSPRNRSKVKLFQDIEAGIGSTNASGETQNMIDDVLNNAFTEEDKEVLDLLRSPARNEPATKRRKIIYKSSRAQRARVDDAEHPVQPQANARPTTPIPPATKQPEVNDEATCVLRDSPSKANELPSIARHQPRPVDEIHKSKQVGETQEREQAGSRAVSQLIAKRLERQEKSSQPERLAKTKPVPKKKGRRSKSVNKTDKQLPVVEEAEAPVEQLAVLETIVEAPAVEDAPAPAVEPAEQHSKSTEMEVDDTIMNDEPQLVDGETDSLPDVVAPERVLAMFKTDFQYYAATCLRCTLDGSCHVRFDDGTSALVPLHQVRNLELRVGDNVKVDQNVLAESDKGKMQKNTSWIVHELGPVAQTESEKEMGTDQRGRVTAKLKQATKPGAKQGTAETVTILISHVRLTAAMFKQFKDREFDPPLKTTQSQSRAETPASGVRLNGMAETPGSRSRKVKSGIHRTSHMREESTHSVETSNDSGMFDGMAFAITFGANKDREDEKTRLTRLIQRNGGTVLSNGFDELLVSFEGEDDQSLTVKPEYANLGFVALITDRHNRTKKYIQALALGLPTLSSRWLLDSLDAKKNTPISEQDHSPLPWHRYLLAAGESAYLNGAIRSRAFDTFSVDETARFADTIANRRKLLGDDGVLYVAPKEKSLLFVMQALGAKHMKCVADLTEARKLITNERNTWNWVYVEGTLTKAAATLFPKGSGGKKRKREDDEGQQSEWFVREGGVTVVNKEFVIQSLILEELLD